MKCAYCAEEIKDEALVCRFCHKDVVLFGPINERLSAIESGVSELRSFLADAGAGKPSLAKETSQESPSPSKAAKAIVSSVLLAWLLFWLTWLPNVSHKEDQVLYALSVTVPPFLSALWLRRGMPWPRRSQIPYPLLGFIAGIAGFAQLLAVDHYYRHTFNPGWLRFLGCYVLLGILLFWVGGAVGRRTRGGNGLLRREENLRVGARRSILSDSKGLPKLVDLIHDLLPLLTLLGSAWLAYEKLLPTS